MDESGLTADRAADPAEAEATRGFARVRVLRFDRLRRGADPRGLRRPRARSRRAIYAVAVSALLGTSALYHRVTWRPAARRWMKRLDHSMIFVLIAGTYTPVALLALRGLAGEHDPDRGVDRRARRHRVQARLDRRPEVAVRRASTSRSGWSPRRSWESCPRRSAGSAPPGWRWAGCCTSSAAIVYASGRPNPRAEGVRLPRGLPRARDRRRRRCTTRSSPSPCCRAAGRPGEARSRLGHMRASAQRRQAGERAWQVRRPWRSRFTCSSSSAPGGVSASISSCSSSKGAPAAQQPQARAHARDVRVDRHIAQAVGEQQHARRGLAPHAGQAQQVVARLRQRRVRAASPATARLAGPAGRRRSRAGSPGCGPT